MKKVFFDEVYIEGIRGSYFDGCCKVGVIANSQSEAMEKMRETVPNYAGSSIGCGWISFDELSEHIQAEINENGYFMSK